MWRLVDAAKAAKENATDYVAAVQQKASDIVSTVQDEATNVLQAMAYPEASPIDEVRSSCVALPAHRLIYSCCSLSLKN